MSGVIRFMCYRCGRELKEDEIYVDQRTLRVYCKECFKLIIDQKRRCRERSTIETTISKKKERKKEKDVIEILLNELL